jgi:hypothetical protein
MILFAVIDGIPQLLRRFNLRCHLTLALLVGLDVPIVPFPSHDAREIPSKREIWPIVFLSHPRVHIQISFIIVSLVLVVARRRRWRPGK